MQDPKHQYIDWETTREMDERKAKEDLELARLVGAVEGLARTQDGVHFLRWLMDRSGFLGGVPALPHETMAYMEGQRSVGLAIFDLMKRAHCVEAVCQEDING